MSRLLIAAVVTIVTAGGASAQIDAPAVVAGQLRGFVLEQFPDPLYEDHKQWGMQKETARGIEWKGKGPVPKVQKSHKNHGVWRRMRATAINPRHDLVVDLRNFRKTGPETQTFSAFVSFGTRVEAEQENWRSGVRLYRGTFKARMRVQAVLDCELTTKLVKSPTSWIPDVLVQVRVLSARVSYADFVTEHVGKVGGELAEWIGETGHSLLNQMKPSLERNLMEKANAAIVRAGRPREFRISPSKLIQG